MEKTIYVDNEPSDIDYADGLYAVYGSEDAVNNALIKEGTQEMTVGVYELKKVLRFTLEMKPEVKVVEVK